jgi:hypothetical protein
MKYDWQAIDSGKEQRTWQIEVDIKTTKSIEWIHKILKPAKLKERWVKKIVLKLLPATAITDLAKKVKLENKDFTHWASSLTLSFNGQNKVILQIKTPNIWISADLMRGVNEFESLGGSIGSSVGNMFTPGLKIESPKTINDLIALLKRSKGKIWGMVVYAHGNLLGSISPTRKSGKDNQRTLINELKRYRYKLAKIYMMQCYSGYKGMFDFSEEYKDKCGVTKKMNKSQIENYLKNMFKKRYSMSYQKVTSVDVKLQKNAKYKINIKIKYNWESAWKQVGIYTHLYQGTNWILIDLGAGWDITKWFGK